MAGSKRIRLITHKLSWLEWVAIALSIWFVLFPRPYVPLFCVLLLLPLAGMVINGVQQPSMAALVTFKKNSKGEDKYDVADFIDFPAWAIVIRVLLDFEFEDFRTLIFPGLLAMALITIILLLTHNRFGELKQHSTLAYVLLIGNCWLYSYGAVYGSNCIFDKSEPTVYPTAVVDKSTHRGRKSGRRYYVHVAPWGHHLDRERISVSRADYEDTDIGDAVDIDLYEGWLGMPWYQMVRHPQ